MAALLGLMPSARALDEVVLTNGRHYFGTIISDTAETLVLSIDGGIVEFPRATVASPPFLGPPGALAPLEGNEADAVDPTKPHPLPGVREALKRLQDFPWARGVRQVPVLVTDRGRWQFLPCVSFWVGDFFQLSFFGDPVRPAAIEASLIRPPDDAWDQKKRLLEYMLSLAPGLAVDPRFDRLDVRGDSFAVGDLWFAVSPPQSEDSPGRWAVRLLHESSLSASRASYAELDAISEPLTTAKLDPQQPRSWQRGSWSASDLAWLHDQQRSSDRDSDGASSTLRNWSAIGGQRVFVPAFGRERGRYVRTENTWSRELAALASP